MQSIKMTCISSKCKYNMFTNTELIKFMGEFDFNNKALLIRWNAEKNQHLVNCRLVSFEEILLALSNRKLIKVIKSNSPRTKLFAS